MKQRTQRICSVLLLFCLLLPLATACKGKGGGTDTAPVTEEPTAGQEEDSWMNIWDADADFVPLSDDRSLDTAGTQADGSWFDSFSGKRNPYWSPTGQFKMKDGKMVMTASDPNRQIFVTRASYQYRTGRQYICRTTLLFLR